MQPKFCDKRTGWYGESCWRQRGKRFLKRLVNRYNRHAQNAQLNKEIGARNES